MTPQEFTVKDWKPWKDHETDEPIKDNYGNVKGSLVLSGVGEPVDGTFKVAPDVGATIYGTITDYQTKSGNTRQKFTRQQREQAPANSPPAAPQGRTFQPRDDASIKAQFAIKAAVQALPQADTTGDNAKYLAAVENLAKRFYTMVDSVKTTAKAEATFKEW